MFGSDLKVTCNFVQNNKYTSPCHPFNNATQLKGFPHFNFFVLFDYIFVLPTRHIATLEEGCSGAAQSFVVIFVQVGEPPLTKRRLGQSRI